MFKNLCFSTTPFDSISFDWRLLLHKWNKSHFQLHGLYIQQHQNHLELKHNRLLDSENRFNSSESLFIFKLPWIYF